MTHESDEVLRYWLGDGIERGWPSQDLGPRWFGGGRDVDREIESRFGALVRKACSGGLRDWEHAPLRLLALVIVLDQFPRNMFRGSAQAFQGDARAERLVSGALERGFDDRLPWVGRVFLYMPLMHAEDLALQRRCVECFEALRRDVPQRLQPEIDGNLRFARSHLEIIERFGRFPYRNAALGRDSTEAERQFLKDGPRYGQ